MPLARLARLARLAVALVLALGLGAGPLAACGGTSGAAKAPTASSTLYDRLGRQPAIEVVIDKLLAHLVADERINAAFAHLDADGVAHLRQMLIEQVCDATGGPCTYTGKSMRESHAGMNVTDEQFDALVDDLGKALDEAGVRAAEKDELLAILGGMRGEIVGQ